MRSEPGKKHPISLCLFFTYGMSLKAWEKSGLLDREIAVYNALVQDGARIAFFTYGDISDFELQSRIPGVEIFPAYTKAKKPRWKWVGLLLSLSFPLMWKQELAPYRILKTNQMYGAWIPLLLRQGRRLVVRCGYEHYRFACHQGRPLLNRLILYVLSWIAYRSADQILLTTNDTADFVVQTFGVDRGKITVHPNLIDTVLFTAVAPVTTDRVLFVGRLTAQKNLFSLVDAVRHEGIGLDVLGQGELKQEIEAYVARTGADVRFLGVVPNDQIPALLSRYPVYVLPSLYEGNPKSLLEAMSCSRAIVGTEVEGIRDVIEHEVSGLLCKTNSESLASAIRRLLGDAELRRRLGAKARQYVVQNCSLEKIIENEMGVYHATC